MAENARSDTAGVAPAELRFGLNRRPGRVKKRRLRLALAYPRRASLRYFGRDAGLGLETSASGRAGACITKRMTISERANIGTGCPGR